MFYSFGFLITFLIWIKRFFGEVIHFQIGYSEVLAGSENSISSVTATTSSCYFIPIYLGGAFGTLVFQLKISATDLFASLCLTKSCRSTEANSSLPLLPSVQGTENSWIKPMSIINRTEGRRFEIDSPSSAN